MADKVVGQHDFNDKTNTPVYTNQHETLVQGPGASSYTIAFTPPGIPISPQAPRWRLRPRNVADQDGTVRLSQLQQPSVAQSVKICGAMTSTPLGDRRDGHSDPQMDSWQGLACSIASTARLIYPDDPSIGFRDFVTNAFEEDKPSHSARWGGSTGRQCTNGGRLAQSRMRWSNTPEKILPRDARA